MKAKVDNSRLYEHLGSAIPLHTLWKVFYPGSLLLLGQSWYISFLLKNILGIWVDPWILSVDLTSFRERAHPLFTSLFHLPPPWQSFLVLPSQKKKKIRLPTPDGTFPVGQDPLALYSGLSLIKEVLMEMEWLLWQVMISLIWWTNLSNPGCILLLP